VLQAFLIPFQFVWFWTSRSVLFDCDSELNRPRRICCATVEYCACNFQSCISSLQPVCNLIPPSFPLWNGFILASSKECTVAALVNIPVLCDIWNRRYGCCVSFAEFAEFLIPPRWIDGASCLYRAFLSLNMARRAPVFVMPCRRVVQLLLHASLLRGLRLSCLFFFSSLLMDSTTFFVIHPNIFTAGEFWHYFN
jgi:hypothetical protein